MQVMPPINVQIIALTVSEEGDLVDFLRDPEDCIYLEMQYTETTHIIQFYYLQQRIPLESFKISHKKSQRLTRKFHKMHYGL